MTSLNSLSPNTSQCEALRVRISTCEFQEDTVQRLTFASHFSVPYVYLDYILLPSECFTPDTMPAFHKQPTGKYDPHFLLSLLHPPSFYTRSNLDCTFNAFLHSTWSRSALKKSFESLSFLTFQYPEQWHKEAINKKGKKTRDVFDLPFEQAAVKVGTGTKMQPEDHVCVHAYCGAFCSHMLLKMKWSFHLLTFHIV